VNGTIISRIVGPPRSNRWIWGFTCLPCLWSAVAGALPATDDTDRPRAESRSLAFDQYLVNRRDAPLLPMLEGIYRFTNVGDEPLTITELDPSCGCLRPQLAADQRTYAPGETGYFSVRVATANEGPGPHAYTVRVKYRDPRPREAVVRFKVNLPERKVTVQPSELGFFQSGGEPQSATVYVTDDRDQQIVVHGASSTSPSLTARVLPAERSDSGTMRVPVEIEVAAHVPPGRERCVVTIETDDPEFAHLRIPVMIDEVRLSPDPAGAVTGPPLPQTP
jgi:hypothetical protein